MAARDLQADVGGISIDAIAYDAPRAWWAVVVLMVFQVVSLTQRHILSLMLVDIRADLGLNDFQISLLQGLAFISLYCCAAVLVGGFADRYPAKRILYAAVTICSLGATLTGMVQSYWGMMIARICTGAGGGAANPPAQVLIASLFPKDRLALPMSLYSVAGAIGIGFAFFCGGLLLEATTARSIPGLEAFAPWRQVLIVVALPGLLIAFLSFTLPEPRTLQGAASSTLEGWRQFKSFLMSDRSLFARFAIGYGLASVVIYGVFTWAPTYARRVLELTPAQTGLEMGLISTLGSIIAGAVYGYVVDRQFARGKTDFVLRAFTFGAAFAIPICALGFMIDQHIAFLAGLIVVQCLLSAAFGPGVAAIMMITRPEMRGKMGAIVIVIVNLFGFAIGPLLISALTEFVFGDPRKVGLAIAIVVLALGPISAWSVWTVRPYFKTRIASCGA